MVGTVGVLCVLGLLAVYVVGVYNRLVTLRERVRNAFSQIEVQLKRRHDLIPNLVETTRGYLKHERETLEAVIEARNRAQDGLEAAARDPADPRALRGLSGAEASLSGALGRLSVVVERYPELRADANMRQLSEELTSTDNRVAYARQAFNDAVTFYNTYKKGFPPVALAALFGHADDAERLEYADREAMQAAPRVSF